MVINLIQAARRSAHSQNAQTRLMLRRFALSRAGRFFILKANRAEVFPVQNGFVPIAPKRMALQIDASSKIR